MREHDLIKEVPRDKLEMLYRGYSAWANWFMKYRDDDHDGLPQYEHGDETGNDDSAIFLNQPILELPELSAFLALLFEALGDLGRILGVDTDETDAWYVRSREMIRRMIEAFWTGKRFVALTNGDHKIVATKSVMMYRPLVLGKRLPAEIVDKMAADLDEEGEYLTPYGLIGQSRTSEDFSLGGFSNGRVGGSENLLIITGLYDAGKVELAKKLAKRYCDGVKTGGSPFFGLMPGFAGSWGAAIFQVLANLYSNG